MKTFVFRARRDASRLCVLLLRTDSLALGDLRPGSGFPQSTKMAGATGMLPVPESPASLVPVPTASDRLWFNVCRTAVGVVVLGLTLLNSILCAAPLVAEGLWPAPPSSPPMPAAPYELWTSEDAHATKMILLISSGQAVLLALIAAGCIWFRRGQTADAKAAQLLRRSERDAKEERRRKRAAKRRAAASAQQQEEPLPLVSDLDEPLAGADGDARGETRDTDTASSPTALDSDISQGRAAERDPSAALEHS